MNELSKWILALIGSIFAYTLVRLKDWVDASRKRLEEHVASLTGCERVLAYNLLINKRNLAAMENLVQNIEQLKLSELYFHPYFIERLAVGNIRNPNVVSFVLNVFNRIDNLDQYFRHFAANFITLRSELTAGQNNAVVPMPKAQKFFADYKQMTESIIKLSNEVESDIKEAIAGVQVTYLSAIKRLKRSFLGYKIEYPLPPDFATLVAERRAIIEKEISEKKSLKW